MREQLEALARAWDEDVARCRERRCQEMGRDKLLAEWFLGRIVTFEQCAQQLRAVLVQMEPDKESRA